MSLVTSRLYILDECAMPVWLYERRCGIEYSMSGQDEASYKEGWIPLNYSGNILLYLWSGSRDPH